jgi:Fe(3+) dicitrate transport protein
MTLLAALLLAALQADVAPAPLPKEAKPQDPKPAEKADAGEVLILGEKQDLERIPGSGELLGEEVLRQTRPRDIHEVVRKVPGVVARDEEGLGLRPNYGVRGLLPTRSAKVLLLEDGVPFVIGPYGDNTTYYHPPVERFERLEVLKGAGQILYGPNTVGAVFNYLTPAPPVGSSGALTVAVGNLSYVNVGGTFGAGTEHGGVVLDFLHKEGDGRAKNIELDVDDVVLRTVVNIAPRSSVALKLNYLHEDSMVTYAGLTQSEYEADPRQNPFDDDNMNLTRLGGSLALKHGFSDDVDVLVNVYGYTVQRDWWRQWHNGNNANTIPVNDPLTLPDDQTSGRIREYYVYGVEPRFQARHRFLGIRNETDFGVRAHYEIQDRLLVNGPAIPGGAGARTGTIGEDNERTADAYSGYVQNRFLPDEQWAVTAGLRVEHVRYTRFNALANGGLGAEGEDSLTAWIPGAGVNYLPVPELTLFTGLHRGWAPPRTEDAIDNNGNPTELDPEESWNFELGARWTPQSWFTGHATFFHMDFENQIIPAQVAGGATSTNGGETLHQGAELLLGWDFLGMNGSEQRLQLDAAVTFLWTAEFEGTRFSSLAASQLLPGETVNDSVTGNRLPYAPEEWFTLGLTYAHPVGLDLRLEMVYVGEQYADDRETEAATPNGRRGLLPDYTVWNAAVNYTVAEWGTTFFVSVKNLFDEVYIADRTRGIYAGLERAIAGGVTWRF